MDVNGAEIVPDTKKLHAKAAAKWCENVYLM